MSGIRMRAGISIFLAQMMGVNTFEEFIEDQLDLLEEEKKAGKYYFLLSLAKQRGFTSPRLARRIEKARKAMQ